MKDKIRDESLEYLFEAILSLKNTDECYDLFTDLCTVAELKEMSRRMLAARMLDENAVYTDIAEKTGLSTATISRVNRCLKYGSDGYTLVLERMKNRDKRD